MVIEKQRLLNFVRRSFASITSAQLYFHAQDTYEKSGEKRYDILPLQTGIVILLLILVLIIIVFIVCLIYMRRK